MIAVCALVIGLYAYLAKSDILVSGSQSAADNYYNLLVQGFRAGHLSLNKAVPPGFTHLADPYDPGQSGLYRFAPYGLHDMSYYKGRFYLYFGITPAVLLFWPYAMLTGRYLSYGAAGVIFCAIGLLAGVYLLCALWRRYFAEVCVWVVAACALAFGLATGVLVMLARCKVNEVSISCGYGLAMLALAAIWKALHESSRREPWLVAASVAYGLAIGARPSLLLGAVILLLPVACAHRERRPISGLLMAAVVPIGLIGLGLMLYNALRFDNPFEFGQRYQLAPERQFAMRFFSPHYFWFNVRLYFLQPMRWRAHFPFLCEISVPPIPAGYAEIEDVIGVLTSIPLVWLALAAPLAWRNRPEPDAAILQYFVVAVTLLVGGSVATLLFYNSAILRYEVDFLPALLLLAAVGVLGLERVLSSRPSRQRVVRAGWICPMLLSVAFNLLLSCVYGSYVYTELGYEAFRSGRLPEAVKLHERALRLNPDYALAHNGLAFELFALGRAAEGAQQFERSLQLRPNWEVTHYEWAVALAKSGKFEEAIAHYEEALRLKPDWPDAHNDLGIALMSLGRREEAIAHYEQALRINPNYPQAHASLGNVLFQQGKLDEAAGHYEKALQTWPDSAKLHYNLGLALEKLGRTAEAVEHYQRAVKLRPDSAPAREALIRLGAGN
jgi:tetratricopeptide (TPR) repeat protein